MTRRIDFRYAPQIIQTCIGLVDDEHKTIVREDGSLNYGYRMELIDIEEQTRYAEQVTQYHEPTDDLLGFTYRLKPRFTHRDDLEERRQTYGDPGAAIVTTVEEYTDTRLEWTTFAHETDDGTRVDVVRWTMTASEEFGHAPSRVELKLQGPNDGDLPTIIETPETTAFWTDEATQLPGLDRYAFLESGDTREGAFAIVLEGDLDPDAVTVEWADDALATAEAYWAGIEPFRNEFRIPDNSITDLLVACGRNILQAREERDGVLEYQVGPTEYRGFWIADGYFFLQTAHLMGRGEEAFEHGLLALLRRVRPDGSIQILPKHAKETAIAIATFVRQCELADDPGRLEELWPTILRALDFLEAKHAEAEAMGPEYPAHRLFPPAFLDGGISGPFPELTTPLCVLWGTDAAANAGARLGLPNHERFRRFYEEIREGFEATARSSMRETEAGLPYLPMNLTEREYDQPQSCSTTLAMAAYPGEVFGPDTAYVENLLSLLDATDDREGVPENVGWMHDQGVFTYTAARFAQTWLYAGYPEKAVDYLYAFANHAAPNRAWREEQALRDTHSADFTGDMPHNWASVEFIQLVRNLLVFEVSGGISLLRGLPEEWLPTQENPLVLEATPTKYGSVSIYLKVSEEGYDLIFERRSGHSPPETVRLYWEGEILRSDVELTEVGDEWHLPVDCATAHIVLTR